MPPRTRRRQGGNGGDDAAAAAAAADPSTANGSSAEQQVVSSSSRRRGRLPSRRPDYAAPAAEHAAVGEAGADAPLAAVDDDAGEREGGGDAGDGEQANPQQQLQLNKRARRTSNATTAASGGQEQQQAAASAAAALDGSRDTQRQIAAARFLRIARRSAARFAHFSVDDDQETGGDGGGGRSSSAVAATAAAAPPAASGPEDAAGAGRQVAWPPRPQQEQQQQGAEDEGEQEDWPGPFSTARRLVEGRAAAAEARRYGGGTPSASAAPASAAGAPAASAAPVISWVPARGLSSASVVGRLSATSADGKEAEAADKQAHDAAASAVKPWATAAAVAGKMLPAQQLPRLFDLCVEAVCELPAEALVGSLTGLPDMIGSRLMARLCARRKLTGTLLAELLSGRVSGEEAGEEDEGGDGGKGGGALVAVAVGGGGEGSSVGNSKAAKAGSSTGWCARHRLRWREGAAGGAVELSSCGGEATAAVAADGFAGALSAGSHGRDSGGSAAECITGTMSLTSFEPSSTALECSVSVSELRVPDCSLISEGELQHAIGRNCCPGCLEVLELGMCGRCLSDDLILCTLAPSTNQSLQLDTRPTLLSDTTCSTSIGASSRSGSSSTTATQGPSGLCRLRHLKLVGAYRLTDRGLCALLHSAGSTLAAVELRQCPLITSAFLHRTVSLLLRPPQPQGLPKGMPPGVGSMADGLRSLVLDKCAGLSAEQLVAAVVGAAVGQGQEGQGERAVVEGAQPALPGLQKLSLEALPGLTDALLWQLLKVVGRNLTSLCVAECSKLGDEAVRAMAEHCPKLQHVDVSGLTLLTDAALAMLADRQRGGTAAAASALSYGAPEEVAAAPAIEAGGSVARASSELRSLVLKRTRFSDAALAAFVEAAGGGLELVSFNSVAKAGDAAVAALAAHSRSTLSQADLSWCRSVSDAALGLLADSCANLRELRLYGCSQVTPYFYLGHSNNQLQIVGLVGGAQ